MTHVHTIETPAGPARAHVADPPTGPIRSTVVLGHGAGGGIEARDLAALATALPARGHRVVLVEQPWRVAGKKVAAAPGVLDVGWLAVMDELRTNDELVGGALVVGGRSAGARVAVRTAAATGADAVIALAFPLHPPGRPDKDRGDEARAAGRPLLVLQGERDPFGSAAEVGLAVRGAVVRGIPAADHGFAVPKKAPITQGEALELITAGVLAELAEWVPAPSR